MVTNMDTDMSTPIIIECTHMCWWVVSVTDTCRTPDTHSARSVGTTKCITAVVLYPYFIVICLDMYTSRISWLFFFHYWNEIIELLVWDTLSLKLALMHFVHFEVCLNSKIFCSILVSLREGWFPCFFI